MSVPFKIRAVGFASASLLLLAGCGPSKEEQRLRAELLKNQQELNTVKERIANEQREREAKKKVLVNGEIFIRAKDASVHPLSLVEIAVYQLQTIATHIAAVEADKEKIQAPILDHLAKLKTVAKMSLALLDIKKGELEKIKEMDENRSRITHDFSLDTSPTYSALASKLENSLIQARNTQIQKVKDAEENDRRIKAAIAQTLDDLEKWPASSDYFRQLPPALITTITDSAGRFALELAPDQEVVVVAKSNRQVADEIEHYYWMIRFLPSRVATAKIILANHNIGSSGSADSVISSKKEQPFDAPAPILVESKPD